MRRYPFLVVMVLVLLMSACGGSDGAGSAVLSNEGSSASADVGSGDSSASTDSGSTASDSGSGETADAAGSAGPQLRLLFSVPASGNGIGSGVAFSPDGTEVALLAGGLAANVEIYDVASGSLSRSGPWHGQGTDIFWTNDNRLVAYQPDRISALDATTLAELAPVENTLGAGAERCSAGSFDVRHDVSGNALFAADTAGPDVAVCRVDLTTATTTATLIPEAGGLATAFLRPDGSQVVVGYNAVDALGDPMVAVFDAATMSMVSNDLLAGSEVKAVTNNDIVARLDQFSDGFVGSGQVLPVQAQRDPAGPFIAGSSDGALVLMDASGTVLAQGSDGFRPFAVSADGATVAVLLADSLDVFATS